MGEIAHEQRGARVCATAGDKETHKRKRIEGSRSELRNLMQSRAPNDPRRDQKREPRRIGIAQSDDDTADHRHARGRQSRQERESLAPMPIDSAPSIPNSSSAGWPR